MTGLIADLVSEVQRTGRRQDSRYRTTPSSGTHFVTMVKPEVLGPDTASDAMAEVVRTLGEANVSVEGCALLPAATYGELGFLQHHYPRLHRVATEGARALTSAARGELKALAGDLVAVAAFEAGAYDPALTSAMLEERCRDGGIHKLGSGSYASIVELNGSRVVVLNGFVPDMAGSYLGTPSLVGLVECYSDREIAELRSDVLGPLNPAAAPRASLRGALHALVGGLSEGRNGVHLSAGHLEGMFQAWRFFGAPAGRDLEYTVLGRALAERGVDLAAVTDFSFDHNVIGNRGETVAPHGATENLRREDVLDLVQQWVGQRKELHT